MVDPQAVSLDVATAANTEALDVAEYFVLRRYRHAGVERRAALLLWDRLPGKWTVRVAEGNPGGRSGVQ